MVDSERRDVEEVTDRVSDRLDDAIPREAISERVRRQFDLFEDAAGRQFVPVFVERRIRAELRS